MAHRINSGAQNKVFDHLVPVRTHHQKLGVKIFDNFRNAFFRVAVAQFNSYAVAFLAQVGGVAFQVLLVRTGFKIFNIGAHYQGAGRFYNVNKYVLCGLVANS